MGAPQRIQRKRTKGWRMPDGAVYVGRPGKFGNPFAPKIIPGWATMTREYAAEYFREWLETPVRVWPDGRVESTRSGYEWMSIAGFGYGARYDSRPSIDTIRDELAGKDLACWCPLSQPCHADVLLELANA